MAGFTANWGLTWSQFLGSRLYSAFAVNFGIAIALATLGSAIGNDTLIGLERERAATGGCSSSARASSFSSCSCSA